MVYSFVRLFFQGTAYYNDSAVNGRAYARGFSRWKTGGDSVTTVELFFGLIAVTSLALTIYFGMRR